MTERFYFDIENDRETIHDGEGVEAVSFEQAIEEARIVIDEMADELDVGDSARSWTLVIRSASGALVGRLPIKR
ncbi:hypothetical protein MKL09_31410 [Methylobacterium sp. J-048]|uniref:DUF6894 family protein n=1 Tax=unclassified Methylobacterium TaxID=2615210 RepID=UPI001FB9CD23|nr:MULTISPECIES: hypothetical protein [unclassified Methylobacterium]MCJ2061015.1 hypothetical protein [Methylobacterium sp. J-048]MCJ2124067.1 hypothetical protein [Methylobacterium sp. J-077]